MYRSADAPFMKNGAPRGFGQQSGNSIFLDNPEQQAQQPSPEDEEKKRQQEQAKMAAALMGGDGRQGVNSTMPVNEDGVRPLPGYVSNAALQQMLGGIPDGGQPVGPGPSAGFTGRPMPFHQAMTMGFPTNRDYNTSKSAKDAFAVLSNAEGVPAAPLHDKTALGDWFNQYIRPGMEDQGHAITDVQGDKFRFNNWQGDFWVDFGKDAGSDHGMLDWQADDANMAAQMATAPQAQAMSTTIPSMLQQALMRGQQAGNGQGDLDLLLQQMLSEGNSYF